jgi:hypothetical protein
MIMRPFIVVCSLLASAPLALAEQAWRWSGSDGTVHYSNQRELAPPDAQVVDRRIVIETHRLPGATADDAEIAGVAAKRPPRSAAAEPPRIYDEARLRFGCWASKVLYAGGWAHADDILTPHTCYRFTLGDPQAWLHAARAELAIREHGLDLRAMMKAYEVEQKYSAVRNTSDEEESGTMLLPLRGVRRSR